MARSNHSAPNAATAMPSSPSHVAPARWRTAAHGAARVQHPGSRSTGPEFSRRSVMFRHLWMSIQYEPSHESTRPHAQPGLSTRPRCSRRLRLVECRAARGRDAWRRAVAGGGWCRFRQDPDAGRPRGAAGAGRRRPAPAAADDVLAPRRSRAGTPRRPPAAAGSGAAQQQPTTATALVRHLPQRGRKAAARTCRQPGPGRGLQRHRPRRRPGAAGPGANPTRSARQRAPFSAGADLPRHPFTHPQQRTTPGRGADRALSVVRRTRSRSAAPVCRLHRGQAGAARARLRRPAAVLASGGARKHDRAGDGHALRPCPGRRIPGHQPAAGRHPARTQAARTRRHGGGRRRAVDLRLSCRRSRQHARLSATFHTTGRGADARA